MFVWIRHLRFEIRLYKHIRGYIKLHDNIILPMESLFREEKYEEITMLCIEGTRTVKFLNGNHYHMNLFIELEKLLKELG